MTAFGARLRAATSARGPLCVGIDPHASLLARWGLADDPAGLRAFTESVVDALAGQVAVLKPQSAFFERHGSAGVAVLEDAVREARRRGCLVLLDVKRGDIGSTAQAYADAYLRPCSALAVDAVTVSPFLGFGSLEPFLEAASEHDAGVFVLALTSNPEAPAVQHARSGSGRTVAGDVLAEIAARNAGAVPTGSVGAVVGATVGGTFGDVGEDLAVNGPLLVPGVGTQGGTPQEVVRIFADVLPDVVPSSSREILAAGPDRDRLCAAAASANDGFAVLLRR
jgi:orotidine-5'-phosphate decarboxylase